MHRVNTARVPYFPSLRAKRSRNLSAEAFWIASSLTLLAMTLMTSHAWLAMVLPIAACAAASRAIGTR